MSLSAERYQAIVNAYGDNPERWPQAERDDALAFRNALAARPGMNPDPLAPLDEQLDTLLQQMSKQEVWDDELSTLRTRILQQALPARTVSARPSMLQAALQWLLPSPDHPLRSLWRPAMAASLPLVFGLYLGTQFSFGIDDRQNSREEELMLLSLNDYAEEISP